MNHGYKTQQELQELQEAQAQGKRFMFNGSVGIWNFDTPVDRYTLVEEQSEPASKKRKHADVIIAWANGEDVQVLESHSSVWRDIPHPQWNEASEYRVKPKEETRYYVARVNCLFNSNEQNANVKMIFCGSAGNLLSVEKIK